jgi:hypothetical protein
MANENEKNEFDDDQLNLDDIEGLERDENSTSASNKQNTSNSKEPQDDLATQDNEAANSEDIDALDEISEKNSHDDEKTKPSLMQKIKSIKPMVRYAILGLMTLLVTLIIVFSFMSGDGSENQTATTQATQQQSTPTQASNPQNHLRVPQYEFKLDHINVARLNKELEYLNKYELLGMTQEEYLKQQRLEEIKAKEAQEELERQKELEKQRALEEKLEKERLEKERLEKEKLAQEEAQKEQEEAAKQAQQEEQTLSQEQQQAIESVIVISNHQEVQKPSYNEFIRFIKLQTAKSNIYKDELKELKKVDTRIHACRDIHNNIELLIGPLNDNENEQSIFEKLEQSTIKYPSMSIELTNDEFKARCMAY